MNETLKDWIAFIGFTLITIGLPWSIPFLQTILDY